MWPDNEQQVNDYAHLFNLVTEGSEEGRKEDNASEHRFAYRRGCHLGGHQAAEGAPEEENRCLLLIDLKLFAGFEDQSPLVVVDDVF